MPTTVVAEKDEISTFSINLKTIYSSLNYKIFKRSWKDSIMPKWCQNKKQNKCVEIIAIIFIQINYFDYLQSVIFKYYQKNHNCAYLAYN